MVIHKTMKRSETKVQIDLDITPIKLPITQAIPCGLLLNEIITNSYKHAFKGKKRGRIIVSLSKKQERICLSIKDDGVGLPEQPKSSIQSSLGMTLIKTLAKQLNATFDFRSDGGAIFEFEFSKGEEVKLNK